jgi:hypothetical protein
MYTKTKLFRLAIIISIALFLILAATPAGVEKTQASNGTQVTKIRVIGRFANVFLFDSDTDTVGFVEAGQDRITNTVSLSFSFSTAHPTDPDLAIVLQGAGEIPNTAFTINTNSAQLSLTTPDEYYVNRCVINLITAEYTCSAGYPISFDLTWVRNGIGSVHEKTTRTETFGPVSTKIQGEYSSLTATVNGTWAGINSADMAGNLLDTESKSLIREITLEAKP